jgi:hypothetical protein
VFVCEVTSQIVSIVSLNFNKLIASFQLDLSFWIVKLENECDFQTARTNPVLSKLVGDTNYEQIKGVILTLLSNF